LARKKLNPKRVDALSPKSKRYEVWDSPGFGIRVSPQGRKTWVYLYWHGNKKHRMTLGVYPRVGLAEAREAHVEAERILGTGINPAAMAREHAAATKMAPTVADIAQEYLERYAKPRKRSWREDLRVLEKDILPAFGDRPAAEVSRRDMIRLLDGIVDRGAPIQANRTLAVVRKMFNFAISRDLVQFSPCVQVKAPADEVRRDRVLDARELRLFWRCLDWARMAPETKLAFKLQLATAQRIGEVVSARWGDIDFEQNWWTIPAELSKNRLSHRVPLSPLAIRILGSARTLSGDTPFVFASGRAGQRQDRHLTPGTMNRSLSKNRELFGELEHFTPHDLRRTAASHMASHRVPRLVIQKILNHAEPGVTTVYDRHSYDEEKRSALTTWSTQLEALVSDERLDSTTNAAGTIVGRGARSAAESPPWRPRTGGPRERTLR